MTPFAVADVKFKIPGRPSFENYMQDNNIQDSTKNFKQTFNKKPTVVSCATLIQENSPFFSFSYQTNSEKPTFMKSSTVQTLQFPLKFTKILLLKSGKHKTFFAEKPQTQFLSILKRYFSFMEISLKKSDDLRSVLVKNICLHFEVE